MTPDRSPLQLTLLRTLGVLLIVVGFTMIARTSKSTRADRAGGSLATQFFDDAERCERVRVEVERVQPLKKFDAAAALEGIRIVRPPKAPTPPKPPKAPKAVRAPNPPSAPSFVFVN